MCLSLGVLLIYFVHETSLWCDEIDNTKFALFVGMHLSTLPHTHIQFSAVMSMCQYSTLAGGSCGPSTYNPSIVECVTLENCQKDVSNHRVFFKISDDDAISSESKLLLARAGEVV